MEIGHKWGFGMSQPKHETQIEREQCSVRVIQSIISLDMPAPCTTTLSDLSIIKGMFNRVAREDQWDWFTVKSQLGYVANSLAREIAYRIADFRSAVRDQDHMLYLRARHNLVCLPTIRCLNVFLGKFVISDEIEGGWIYVLATREMPKLLKIGMTTRTVEERVKEINSATGVAIPFGVWRCWRVMQPAAIEKKIHDALQQYRVRGDREFFRVDIGKASNSIRDVLVENGCELRTLRSLSALS